MVVETEEVNPADALSTPLQWWDKRPPSRIIILATIYKNGGVIKTPKSPFAMVGLEHEAQNAFPEFSLTNSIIRQEVYRSIDRNILLCKRSKTANGKPGRFIEISLGDWTNYRPAVIELLQQSPHYEGDVVPSEITIGDRIKRNGKSPVVADLGVDQIVRAGKEIRTLRTLLKGMLSREENVDFLLDMIVEGDKRA